MVSLVILLVMTYYCSVFALFLLFFTFKTVFHINSNSPKIIYQSLIRHYLPKNMVYFLILQFLGIVPSVMFYIKYCIIVHAPLINYSFAIIFLFLNLLTSIFFYFQFFKKWNVMTAQEIRELTYYSKQPIVRDMVEERIYKNKNRKKKYILTYCLVLYLAFNFLAPFYFFDIFIILSGIVN